MYKKNVLFSLKRSVKPVNTGKSIKEILGNSRKYRFSFLLKLPK